MKNKISDEITKIKKELYLKESIKYFDKKGFKNSKISEIALELDTSVGTIYNIFKSKEGLYLEYLIFKLNVFLEKLNSEKVDEPLLNLAVYLKYKYEIFIQIDENENSDKIKDPYFFHKLDIDNHPVVHEIHNFIEKQFKALAIESSYSHGHLAILFKKFSDGFIESYMIEPFDTNSIIDNTIKMFLNGVIKK
ncbi:TetR/AcrR family transcriptional regulator [Poseidonibacter sp.]|uniref:TetR/AcrR family transcriptional regulator n=1 Tax=Poseidonibacter sp. TaxID=2321188 RepID=UPI003C710CC9